MAKDSADDILELMDIVEEGRIPDFTAEPAKSRQNASFDDELDALFGDSEPGGGGSAAMDPNETLDMPDMSDIDSLLSDLDEEALDTSPGVELEEHVAGVDEMLDDLLPKASEPSFEQKADMIWM